MKKDLIKDLTILRKPCEKVTEKDNLKSLIQDLKDSLDTNKGYAIAGNQIGYNKRIFYIKFPKLDPKTKKVEYEESIVINPKIVEKQTPFQMMGESCLSFPGLKLNTFRYGFIIVEHLDENLKPKTVLISNLKAVVYQHEIDHLNGKTIFDKKYRNKIT